MAKMRRMTKWNADQFLTRIKRLLGAGYWRFAEELLVSDERITCEAGFDFMAAIMPSESLDEIDTYDNGLSIWRNWYTRLLNHYGRNDAFELYLLSLMTAHSANCRPSTIGDGSGVYIYAERNTAFKSLPVRLICAGCTLEIAGFICGAKPPRININLERLFPVIAELEENDDE